MHLLRIWPLAAAFWFVILLAEPLRGQSTSISLGQGAPNETIRQRFEASYYRGRFSTLASLPPATTVSTFGQGGFVQEFNDIARTPSVRLGIVVGPAIQNPDGTVQDAFHIYAPMYAFYRSADVGVALAGFPLGDTEVVSVFDSNGLVANTYQLQSFQRAITLFAWNAPPDPTSTLTQFVLREPFNTRWRQLGFLGGLGPVTGVEIEATSVTGIRATRQSYLSGFLFNMETGPSAGRVVAVREPINSVYRNAAGPTGALGFPLNDEIVLANGRRRQSFEGGSIEYAPGQTPVIRTAVGGIALSSAGSIRLNLGDTLPITARLVTTAGETVTDRDVSWASSNSRVVQVVVQGLSPIATLRAVGGGSAFITATSEGRTSSPLTVFVSAPCCAIGEGAPSVALQQSFLDAVQRGRLNIRTPSPTPVRRVGNGYLQELFLADGGTRIWVAKPDSAASAFLVLDPVLSAYEALGGPAGPLGYPLSDPSPGGRQLFENRSALAGDPVRIVSAPILDRWAQLNYEAGPLGNPVSDAASFLTFAATNGRAQSFRGGQILVADNGLQSGRPYVVTGLVATAYAAEDGPLGRFGLPISDEFLIGGARRQEFEGATVDYAPGETSPRVTEKPRRPLVTATPSTVVAGNRVRLAIGGFAPRSRLRVSLPGQPDFQVDADSGAYAWEIVVPANARSGVVPIRVTVANSNQTAEGAYTVRAQAETRFEISKLRGDTQTGAPGALLAIPLRVQLRDEFGSPVVNFPVRFSASPGGQIVQPAAGAPAFTNDRGEAEAWMRLPAVEGVALATAEAARVVTTFSFRVAAQSLPSFPRLTQAIEQPLGNGSVTIARKGALLAAVASIIRFHQQRGELPQPNGPADPGVLNQFLRDQCVFDASNARICDAFLTPFDTPGEQWINLWRAGSFTGGGVDVSIENSALPVLRDLVSAGSPVILALDLTSSGAPSGSHFVVATGVAANGALQIFDPQPTWNRTTLDEYLNGFTAAGSALRGSVTGAVRLLPRAPSGSSFLLVSNGRIELASNRGPCSPALEVSQVASIGEPLANSPARWQFRACEGGPQPHQLDLIRPLPVRAVFTELGTPAQRVELNAGSGTTSYRIARGAGSQYLVAAQTVSLDLNGIVNAASFAPQFAPGAIVSLFGAGLARPEFDTSVEFGGRPGRVLFASPFQLNVQIPPDAPPGDTSLRVRSAFGQADSPVALSEVAPAIFLLGPDRGAILNQDNSINSPTQPALRGQAVVIFGTGFGATRAQGNLQLTQTPVTAVLAGRTLQAAFAGLTPGFFGLYQVNLIVPPDLAPGTNLRLFLTQGVSQSNTVALSVQ